MASVKVDDRTFEGEVLKSPGPVLVDFWAPWCGPCRAMTDVVEQVAEQVGGDAKVVKVNVDEAPESATRFGVQSIPSFVVFRNGSVASQAVGVVSKDRLLSLLQASEN